MTDRKSPVAISIMYAVIAAVIVLLAVNFYPRDLRQVAGLQDITPDDITRIQLSMAIYEEVAGGAVPPRSELIAQNEIITDRDFFEDVLDMLENHTVRRRLLSRGVDYRRVDLTRPSIVFLSVSFDNRETLFIDISNDSRFMAIWSGESAYTRYRLYGEGLDTNKLYESVLKLNLTPGD